VYSRAFLMLYLDQAEIRKCLGDLAKALGVDTQTVQIMEEQRVIKNMDMNRRKLLIGMLGIPAALLGLSGEPQIHHSSSISDDRMNFFEHQMATRWDIYHTGGTIRASHGLDTWMKEINGFANSLQGTDQHGRALAIIAMSHQLRGSIARDLMQYQLAHSAYKQAFRVAQELHSSELMASALARRGVTLIQQDRPLEAITYLEGALHTVDGLDLPILKGYILQGLSEAYAKALLKQECLQSIGQAELIFEHYPLTQGRTQNLFSTASIKAQKGVDTVLLHDYKDAIAQIDISLITYDPTLIRGRARLIAQKAEAYFNLGMIDESTQTAEEALRLAKSVGSNKTITRVSNLYLAMTQSSWSSEHGLVQLGALLQA
jgi:tetratricopeptide (TPR) repeat protein